MCLPAAKKNPFVEQYTRRSALNRGNKMTEIGPGSQRSLLGSYIRSDRTAELAELTQNKTPVVSRGYLVLRKKGQKLPHILRISRR